MPKGCRTTRGKRPALLAALAITGIAGAVPCRAQEPRPASCSLAPDTTPERPPDIVIRARVRADEVRFETQPSASVRLLGCPVESVVTERRNLPQPVRAGVTYRDVEIAAEWNAWIDVACLLDARGDAADTVPSARRDGQAPPAGPDAAAGLERCLRLRPPDDTSRRRRRRRSRPHSGRGAIVPTPPASRSA